MPSLTRTARTLHKSLVKNNFVFSMNSKHWLMTSLFSYCSVYVKISYLICLHHCSVYYLWGEICSLNTHSMERSLKRRLESTSILTWGYRQLYKDMILVSHWSIYEQSLRTTQLIIRYWECTRFVVKILHAGLTTILFFTNWNKYFVIMW